MRLAYSPIQWDPALFSHTDFCHSPFWRTNSMGENCAPPPCCHQMHGQAGKTEDWNRVESQDAYSQRTYMIVVRLIRLVKNSSPNRFHYFLLEIWSPDSEYFYGIPHKYKRSFYFSVLQRKTEHLHRSKW